MYIIRVYKKPESKVGKLEHKALWGEEKRMEWEGVHSLVFIWQSSDTAVFLRSSEPWDH